MIIICHVLTIIFIEHSCVCQLDHFLIEDLHPVMVLDASLASHSIVQMVGHPDEITELFDTISYNKVWLCCSALIVVNTQMCVYVCLFVVCLITVSNSVCLVLNY
jgi:hypothetical protein